ncbi:serine hydroxymethyltransferase [Devosia nitrariae]|uniref:Serine hydroxymethyltransferase n=1 Tax=Devosia nitrariae TaxID=2071872 RepID=A0ABQ5W5J3_9HYPH|nr:serine hydroxymethyltransferase [Devosia nitrariae]GLQ55200.1 serine hydroxymethyltransferase [Devosia nitrariae]
MDVYRDQLAAFDPDIFSFIAAEERRQSAGIELIPSENYTYPEVLSALGSVLTNKYSEGYPGRRYYGGQENTDAIENVARERACALFRAQHANVQPLSGSPMNQAVYFGLLAPGDTILAMDLSHGGHLTHGAPVSHMGKVFNFVRYKTEPDGSIDYDRVMELAKANRPKLVLAGHSSYPREYDYAAFRRIADAVGARAMADISHLGGLVAANVLANPLDAGFDVVTTTTHKSLRGPRGGLILCSAELAKTIDSAVFPGLQGGPHMNQVAAAAITFKKAMEAQFLSYARQVLANARTLAGALAAGGAQLVTGGTDNHLMVVNTVESFGLDGRQAEETLDRIGVTVNRQIVPDDQRPPLRPSGIRLGTPASTTRGMVEGDMELLAGWMISALQAPEDTAQLADLHKQVSEFCRQFAVPGVEQS